MDVLLHQTTLSTLFRIEQEIEQRYQTTLKPYLSQISDLGFSYEIHLSWKNTCTGVLYKIRPEVINGYASFITLQIKEQSGEIVESTDHDMYMDFAWIVSEYKVSKYKVSKYKVSKYKGNVVHVFDNVDDDAVETLDDCINFLKNPY